MAKHGFAIICMGMCLRATGAQPLGDARLHEVKPVMGCEEVAALALDKIEGETVSIKQSTLLETAKGSFCKVSGQIGAVTAFEVDLPMERWTQRMIENAFNASGIAYAGSCAPALDGEFAVVFNSPAFGLPPGAPPATELQSRIDSAYRATHLTAQAAKAVIKAFYGQPQRYAYFLGCSAGGLQAMNEAQRYPQDFDGISAGSPLLLNSVHNIFFHPWESYINRRADGSRILAASRMPLLHRAVMEHCAAASGVLDGVLLQPTACRFDPAWVQCGSGQSDSSQCLTAEETHVVQQLYEGPNDGQGHRFEIAGFTPGAELRWGLSTADHVANPEAKGGNKMKRLLAPPESSKSAAELEGGLAFTQEWYLKAIQLAPLFNATNTDLSRYQQHGGKLILWNGGEDLTIQPEVSVAYYQGVQKAMGVAQTDAFMRLFMIPGFGHCMGGEIPFQIDVLTPLMAWVEQNRAPEKILASNPAGMPGESNPYDGKRTPLAQPDRPNLFTRPIFAFPRMARYSGQGDVNAADSYKPVSSAAPVPQSFHTQVADLFAPNNQKSYHVEGDQLVPDVPSVAARAAKPTNK